MYDASACWCSLCFVPVCEGDITLSRSSTNESCGQRLGFASIRNIQEGRRGQTSNISGPRSRMQSIERFLPSPPGAFLLSSNHPFSAKTTQILMEKGLLPRLIQVLGAEDRTLRLSSLWAFKNLLLRTLLETKKTIMGYLKWSELTR